MPTVVITGASSGIGRDAALLFNELGFTVYAGVRRLDDGERVRAAAAHPRALRPLPLDVTDAGQVAAARDVVAGEVASAGLTALVSNAGIAALSGPSSCEECPLEIQKQIMEVNFFGAVRVLQAFLPLLRAGRGTVVVNSALMAHTVIPFNAGYAASKAALEAWTDSLRREITPLGVNVAIVEAAYISSEMERKQQRPRGAESGLYPLETALHDAASRASRRPPVDRPPPPPRRRGNGGRGAVASSETSPHRGSRRPPHLDPRMPARPGSGRRLPPGPCPAGPPMTGNSGSRNASARPPSAGERLAGCLRALVHARSHGSRDLKV